ncbi:MAG: S24 family peptidase [Lachnospiraceae bacterium]
MNKVTTSDRLKQIMRDRDLRQVDILELCKPLCDKYNVKIERNGLSQYVSGKVEPKQDKLSIISQALKINEAWLMGYDVPMNRNTITSITTKSFPLIGDIACGIPKVANESLECYIEAGTNIKADFCLKAKGDSMINARIYDGDIVFVRSQDTVENGEIAVVIVNDEATLKRVFYYADHAKLVLQAENPKYEPLVYVGSELEHIRILGKAIAFQSDVR